MSAQAALFLFLAATVLGLCAFGSVVAWISVPLREQRARERIALLRSVSESSTQEAARVLEYLREEDRRRAAMRSSQERSGWIAGGLLTLAAGIGIGAMLALLGDGRDWAVGLIPSLVGLVLLMVGLTKSRSPV